MTGAKYVDGPMAQPTIVTLHVVTLRTLLLVNNTRTCSARQGRTLSASGELQTAVSSCRSHKFLELCMECKQPHMMSL
eukprot:COSAG02_NODE_4387_length_5419_cov_4.024436_2_plen_78_part_00